MGFAAIFAAAHLVPLLSASFAAVLVSRAVAALACAGFWAVGAVLAGRIAAPGRTAQVMGILVGGPTLANVIGVPAGTWVGQGRGREAGDQHRLGGRHGRS